MSVIRIVEYLDFGIDDNDKLLEYLDNLDNTKNVKVVKGK
jgi:hypothetical protein